MEENIEKKINVYFNMVRVLEFILETFKENERMNQASCQRKLYIFIILKKPTQTC